MSNTVPAGWNRTTLGKVAKLTMGQSPLSDTYNTESHGLPFFQGKADFGSRYPRIRYWCSEPTKVASEQSILFSVRAPVGEVNITPYECCIGRGLAGIYGETANQEFLFQKLQYAKPRFQLLSQGSTFEAVNGSDLKEFDLTLPPLPEQQKIATILSSVDDVIEKTRAQIDKLKDLKIGMMQELLTKGIGHTAFKDSPVGRIPADWSVVEIGEIALQVKPGPFGSSLTKAMYVSSGYKVYGQEQVISGDFKVGDYYIDQAKYDELSAFKVSGGDVLISLVGTFGQIAVVPEDFQCGIINPRLLIIRFPLNLVNTEFIAQQLKSDYVLNQLKQLQQGGTMGVLSATTVKPVKLIIPPIEQQRLIGQAMKSVDKSILAKEAQLESTKNTKKALMQDLLTGKVRVNLTDKESAVV